MAGWRCGLGVFDQLAERLGMDRQSPLRARAGVGYVVLELTNEGHCAFPETELIKKATELLGIEEAMVQVALGHKIGESRLVRDRVADESWIYLVSLHRAAPSWHPSLRGGRTPSIAPVEPPGGTMMGYGGPTAGGC